MLGYSKWRALLDLTAIILLTGGRSVDESLSIFKDMAVDLQRIFKPVAQMDRASAENLFKKNFELLKRTSDRENDQKLNFLINELASIDARGSYYLIMLQALLDNPRADVEGTLLLQNIVAHWELGKSKSLDVIVLQTA